MADIGKLTVEVEVDMLFRRESIEAIRHAGIDEAFAHALVSHLSQGRAAVYDSAIEVDCGAETPEGVIDGPELVLRLLEASAADLRAAMRVVSSVAEFARESNTGIIKDVPFLDRDDPLGFDTITIPGGHAEDVQRAIETARRELDYDPTRPRLK